MGMRQATVALAGARLHIFTTENRLKGIFYRPSKVEEILVVVQHAPFPTLTVTHAPDPIACHH